MKSKRFDPAKDLPPTAFDEGACRLASEMKRLGLEWEPHVGCFVWDPEGWIPVESPFPGRVYFILSLSRFLEIFGTTQEMVKKLVWLPTWHQACLLLQRIGFTREGTAQELAIRAVENPTEALLAVYALIIDALDPRRG